MPYFVEVVAPVRSYLDQVTELSDSERKTIVHGFIEELSEDADRFLALYPLAHESLCFWYEYPFPHDRKIFDFRFVVDASHLEMGVVRVAYVECTVSPID